jgi:hypothetical protein
MIALLRVFQQNSRFKTRAVFLADPGEFKFGLFIQDSFSIRIIEAKIYFSLK